MLKLELRPQPSVLWRYASPMLALCLTVLLGIGLFLLLGKDPLRGLQMFFWEPLKSAYALGELMVKATPLLVIALGKQRGMDAEREHGLVTRLLELPALIESTLTLDPVIRKLAEKFVDKQHALFLGRGALYPIAMEGSLKLKEISYIHAEAYAAGELKHGPLALVDADMPVITVAPNNDLLEKLKSNLQEVRARGGELIVFADPDSGFQSEDGVTVITMPRHVSYFQAPIVYTIPLQLLSYHVATLRGTDVDKPRNLAKSVTVE